MKFDAEKLLTPIYDFRPLFKEGPNKHIKINQNGFVIGAKATKNELQDPNHPMARNRPSPPGGFVPFWDRFE